MKTIKNLKAEEIRKSILQLAIQGKLVKQDPNDEPASELVKRIYEEKKKLIAEGKIKKDKNESYIFKGEDNCYYEKIGKNEPIKLDNLPFDIPDSWIWIRLKSLSNIYNGNSINDEEKKKKYSNVIGRDFIATKDVGFDRTIAYNNGINIPFENTSFKIAPTHKILLCIEGGSAGRKIAITDREVCFGNKLACFDTFIVNDLYLFNIFQSNEFLSIFKSSLNGIIGGVSINTLKDFIIPLPPLEEQQRIVNKINSFEPLIQEYDKNEKLLTELESSFTEKMKKSILQYAIEGKLVKQDPNDEPASVLLERIKAEKEKLIKEGKIKRDKNESYIYQGDDKNYYENLPKTWISTTIKNISISIGDGIHGTPNYDLNGEYSFINGSNLINGVLDLSSAKKCNYDEFEKYKKPINKNTIFISINGTLGNLAKYRNEKIILGKSAAYITLVNDIAIDWIIIFLKSKIAKNHFQKAQTGTTIKNIPLSALRTLLIPIIPINEISRIINRVNIINQLLN